MAWLWVSHRRQLPLGAFTNGGLVNIVAGGVNYCRSFYTDGYAGANLREGGYTLLRSTLGGLVLQAVFLA